MMRMSVIVAGVGETRKEMMQTGDPVICPVHQFLHLCVWGKVTVQRCFCLAQPRFSITDSDKRDDFIKFSD